MPGGRRAGPGRPGPGSVHAPAAVLTSFGERGRVPGKAPGNAHQRVAVLGQSLPRYPAPAVHRGRLVERWGEAVAEYRCAAAGYRLIERLFAANPAPRMIATPGREISTWPALSASSCSRSTSTAAMSACRAWWRARSRASRCARCPASFGGGRHARHRCTQYWASALLSRPVARVCNDRTVGARPAKAAAHASTA